MENKTHTSSPHLFDIRPVITFILSLSVYEIPSTAVLPLFFLPKKLTVNSTVDHERKLPDGKEPSEAPKPGTLGLSRVHMEGPWGVVMRGRSKARACSI